MRGKNFLVWIEIGKWSALVRIMLAVFLTVAMMLSSGIARASESSMSDSDSYTVTWLAKADAAELAARSGGLSHTTSGIEPDIDDVQAAVVSDGTDSIIFVSYGLSIDNGKRSFIGQYVDQEGNLGQTVEVVYSSQGMSVWNNGAQIDMMDMTVKLGNIQRQARDDRPMSAQGHSACWWLYKYAQGRVAWGTLVAAVGGVAALFTGQTGLVIAAAGGLEAAQGGISQWVVSLFCPASEA